VPEPINVIAEVQQHLGEGRVRAVSMAAHRRYGARNECRRGFDWSPITFMTRPSVPSPTGTVIGPPVSVLSFRAPYRRGQHRHRAHAAFAQVLLHFGDHIDRFGHVKNRRKLSAAPRKSAVGNSQ